MKSDMLRAFLSGAFVLAALAVAVYYERYWGRTRDRLFAALGVAFVLLAFERSVLAFIPPEHDGRHWIFLVRLVAFVIIIVGVVDKNRRGRR